MACPTPMLINVQGYKVPVPCGKCLACRIDQRNMWTWRILAELVDSDGVFLTLTIDDDHLVGPSLKKASVQRFIKRLRKRLGGRKIKYFAVGEYGSDNLRPHYHLILCNVSLGKPLTIDYGDVDDIHHCWRFGFIDVKPANKSSIRYVLKYLDKQQDSKEFEKLGLTPPFRLMSQGIGADWIKRNGLDLLNEDNQFYFDGAFRPLPRYYKEKLGLIDKYRSDYSDVDIWARVSSNPNKYSALLKKLDNSGLGFYNDVSIANEELGRQYLLDLEKKVAMKK